MDTSKLDKRPWTWVPPLYYTQGLPYIIVVTVSVIMYKKLGIDNAEIGLYTSLLYLPWVIKPLWSPFVELKSTKRKWFLAMQFLIALAFLGVGLVLPLSGFFVLSLAFFWLAAFASATNDIAADGYYMIALSQKKQSFFIGIRSTFYRLAMVTGQGLIVILAGYLEMRFGDNQKAWSYTMIAVALLMLLLTISNFVASPKVEKPREVEDVPVKFFEVFRSFFKKKQIGLALAFILLYRLGESQLVKMASPFLLDDKAEGGLALSTSEVGVIYGTFGLIALSIGGILGGLAISRDGLKKWMLPMIIALNLPNAFYFLLAAFQPDSVILTTAVVVIEQFGYGFGFAAFLMYLIYVAEGISKTAHYAIATGFMALGMMLPGMISGFVQEALGYEGFFIWVVIAAFPALLLSKHIDYPPDYGKKVKQV